MPSPDRATRSRRGGKRGLPFALITDVVILATLVLKAATRALTELGFAGFASAGRGGRKTSAIAQ